MGINNYMIEQRGCNYSLDQAYVRKFFDYDEDTGNLVRKVMTSSRAKVGDIAGSPDKDGYIVIHCLGKQRKAHHLVWLHYYGDLPKMIDHINRDPSDNRIENLRLTDKSFNALNSGLYSHNTSGRRGVCYSKRLGKFEAYIKIDGVKRNLGLHFSFDDAVKAREIAEDEFGVRCE